jgi:hypothetical protein
MAPVREEKEVENTIHLKQTSTSENSVTGVNYYAMKFQKTIVLPKNVTSLPLKYQKSFVNATIMFYKR